MKEKLDILLCKKLYFTFIVALLGLIGFGLNGLLFAQPTAKDSPSTSDQFEPIAKAIQQKVKELEYPDDVGQDLAKMVSSWECINWRHRLEQARLDFQDKKLSADQVAQIEEEVIKELYQTMRKEITCDYDYNLEYCNLYNIIKDKKALCLGYAQLLYILGNSIGLSVETVYALEPPTASFPNNMTHTASLISLCNSKVIMTDLAVRGFVSNPFVLKEEFTKDGNYLQLKDNNNPLGIHRRIQIWDANGLLTAIYLSRGYEFQKLGKYTEAESILTKAIQLNPLYEAAYANRGVAFENLGKHLEAIYDCDKAIELNPKSAASYCSRGSVYGKSGKIAEAISDYDKAIELDPKFVDAYDLRGRAYVRSNKFQEAISDYDKAIKINPKYAAAYLGRGLAYAHSKKYLEAISDLTRSIELDPKTANADVFYSRGVSYYKSVIYTEAISDLTRPKPSELH